MWVKYLLSSTIHNSKFFLIWISRSFKKDEVFENVSEVSSTISEEEEQSSMSVKSLLICGSSNDVEEEEENYTEWSIWIWPDSTMF